MNPKGGLTFYRGGRSSQNLVSSANESPGVIVGSRLGKKGGGVYRTPCGLLKTRQERFIFPGGRTGKKEPSC